MRRAHVDADHVQSLDTADVIRSVNATMKSAVFMILSERSLMTLSSPVSSESQPETEFLGLCWKGCDN